MQQTVTERRYVDVREIAKLTGFCPRTIQTMYQDRGMPHVRFGRSVRFDPAKVTEWLERTYGQNTQAK